MFEWCNDGDEGDADVDLLYVAVHLQYQSTYYDLRLGCDS